MIGKVKNQLNELLIGFFDLLSEPIRTIFDFWEIELLMCGLPEINLEDWRNNTENYGEFDHVSPNHDTFHWYWDVVKEFDQ